MGMVNHEYQLDDWWRSERANRVGVVVLELLNINEVHDSWFRQVIYPMTCMSNYEVAVEMAGYVR